MSNSGFYFRNMLEVDYAQQKDDQSKTEEIPQGEVQQSLMITTGVIKREQTTSYQSVSFGESRYAEEGAMDQRTQFGENQTRFEKDVEYHTEGKMQNMLDLASSTGDPNTYESQDFKKFSDSIKVEKWQNNPYCESPKGQPSLDDVEQKSERIPIGVIECEQTTSYQSVPFGESRYTEEGAMDQRTQFGENQRFENDVEYHTGGKMQNKLDPAISTGDPNTYESQDFKKFSDSIKVEKWQNNPYCEMPKGQPSLDDGEQKSERIPREKPENLEPENKLKSTFLKGDLQKRGFKQSTVVSCDTSTQRSTQLSTTQTTFKQPHEELGKTPAFQEEEDICFEEVKGSVVEEKKIDENIVSLSKKTDPVTSIDVYITTSDQTKKNKGFDKVNHLVTRSKNHPPVKDACQTEDKASLKSTKKHPNKVQDGDKPSSHQNTSSRTGNGEINRSINVGGFFYKAPEVTSKRKGTMESFAGNKKKQRLDTNIQTRSTTTETGRKQETNGKKRKRKRAVTKCKKKNGETSKSDSFKNRKRRNEEYRLKSDSAIKEFSRDSEVLSSTVNVISVRSASSTGEKSCPVSGQFNVEQKEKKWAWLLYVTKKEYEKMCDTTEPVDVESHGTYSASSMTSLIPNFQLGSGFQ